MSVKPHKCPVCGKLTTNAMFCSRKCRGVDLKKYVSKGTLKIKDLDGRNLCAQCKKEMPLDRYSMYCEECEMHIEETY